jgi:hypothetical protein
MHKIWYMPVPDEWLPFHVPDTLNPPSPLDPQLVQKNRNQLDAALVLESTNMFRRFFNFESGTNIICHPFLESLIQVVPNNYRNSEPSAVLYLLFTVHHAQI